MTPARIRLAGLVAAALAAATGLVGLSSGPATAAVCSTAGISAVVDANGGAGGGIQTYCDGVSGTRSAAAVFGDVGVSMERNTDGSVCKVNGKPAGIQCGKLGNQYWGLFWSNGKDGTWIYSQEGVDSLTVPKNGSVAWAWQTSTTQRKPGVAAPVVKAAPTKTPTPTPKPTRKPKPTKRPKPTKTATTATPTPVASAAATASALASASATASATPTPSASASTLPSVSASASPSPSETASDTPSDTSSATPNTTSAQQVDNDFTPAAEHSDLPVWVPIAVILVLAGAAGGTVWWRRRSATP